jgi:hypothetical protein
MTDTKKKTLTITVTINDQYDDDLYRHLVAISSRRRGVIMLGLCKKGFALDRAMWKQTAARLGLMGNAQQKESPMESHVESLDTPKYRVNYED